MRVRVAAFLLTFAAISQSATSAQTAPASANVAAAAVDSHAQQNFTIVNNSGHTIMGLNVSPHGESGWGPDILGGDTIASGESAAITFPRGETECEFDIRATYDDGHVTDARKVNLCEVATVTLTAH